jgi:hypothetical protein
MRSVAVARFEEENFRVKSPGNYFRQIVDPLEIAPRCGRDQAAPEQKFPSSFAVSPAPPAFGMRVFLGQMPLILPAPAGPCSLTSSMTLSISQPCCPSQAPHVPTKRLARSIRQRKPGKASSGNKDAS